VKQRTKADFGVRAAIAVFADDDHQRFCSQRELNASQSTRIAAFTAYTLLRPGVTVIEDATIDPRFSDNPYVVGPPFIRFFAGAPLVDRFGHLIGTYCVVDVHTRGFDADEQTRLQAHAKQVVDLVEQGAQVSDEHAYVEQLLKREAVKLRRRQKLRSA
jgi:GAF domain-containing protein